MSTKPLCIVVGTTLGEASDAVVATGARIARAMGATIHLVNAFEVPLTLGGAPFEPAAAYEFPPRLEEIARWNRQGMENQIARLEIADGAPIVRQVEQGPAHRVLGTVAQRVGAELIVVGASDTLAAHTFGSTASRVVRRSTCPVLVLRGALRVPPQQVLMPVDLSPISGEVVSRGLGLLEGMGGAPAGTPGQCRMAVEALFVVVPVGYESFVPHFDLDGAERAGAEKLGGFLTATAGARWQIALHCSFGGAREEVLNRIAETRPDLVVVGTHGRSGFDRFMLGSVAESVVRGCRTSVLVVPPLAARAAAAEPASDEQATVSGTAPAGGHRASARETERTAA
jgi:universal stress protein E